MLAPRRAARRVGARASVHGGTFHATGHRLLRQFGPDGRPRRATSRIMDQGDAEDLIQLARAQPGLRRAGKAVPEEGNAALHLLAAPQHRTPGRRHPRATSSRSSSEFARDIVRIFAEYTSRKAERNLVDYDDLLLFWALMLEQSPALADRIAGLYDHILVDEYQDTNLLQARILRGMCRGASQHHGRRRRRAEHLLVPRRELPEHPRLPARSFPATTIVDARAELPLDAADPRRDQHAHLARARAVHEEALDACARAARRRGSSPRATSSSRRASSSTASSSCTKRARRSARSRCSSAPATCRPTSRSSSPTGRSRSRSGAGSSSSRRRT